MTATIDEQFETLTAQLADLEGDYSDIDEQQWNTSEIIRCVLTINKVMSVEGDALNILRGALAMLGNDRSGLMGLAGAARDASLWLDDLAVETGRAVGGWDTVAR